MEERSVDRAPESATDDKGSSVKSRIHVGTKTTSCGGKNTVVLVLRLLKLYDLVQQTKESCT